jgi:hypothetical protein
LVANRPPGRPRARTARARPRKWRDILAAALAQQEAVTVRGTVTSHLRRKPTRAEITAARRAAHGLAASGQATILRVRPPGFDGPGSAHLILARAGTSTESGLLDQIADASRADRTRMRFEPTVMAQDLATSVELLSAAIQAIPSDRLNHADVERLVASLDASLEALRQIRRHLRREVRAAVGGHGAGSGDLTRRCCRWQPLEAREAEDGHERVDREAPRQEEQDKPHPARLEAR